MKMYQKEEILKMIIKEMMCQDHQRILMKLRRILNRLHLQMISQISKLRYLDFQIKTAAILNKLCPAKVSHFNSKLLKNLKSHQACRVHQEKKVSEFHQRLNKVAVLIRLLIFLARISLALKKNELLV